MLLLKSNADSTLAALPLMILGILTVYPLAWQAESQAVSFFYPNDSSSDFLLLGDAVEKHQVIELTKITELEGSNGSAGRLLRRTPVRMIDRRTGQMASFSTSFSFRIYTVNSSYQGDGLCFLIAPDNATVGYYGEQLGAFTSKQIVADKHTFAVEFDTWQNSDIHDPNGNHVGLDATNVTSFLYNNASNVGVQLNDGSIITAWIDYDGVLRKLQVRISKDSVQPVDPLIVTNVDFEEMFHEFMYVGFSASTGSSNEAHSLLSWSFSSWGLQDSSEEEDQPSSQLRAKISGGLTFALCLIGAFIVLACGLLVWRLIKKAGAESYFRRAKDYESKLACLTPRAFSYKELYIATQGFSERQKLGKNCMGSFFKGVLPDSGVAVAVKRISNYFQEGLEEFLTEVSILTSLRHRNLVPLQGWTLEKGELMLVYELMPNDSLDRFLFDKQYDALSWAQRYEIAKGVAAGLQHLHEGGASYASAEGNRTPGWHGVLHRDVKASNVMLDNNFNARLGDYGLGRLVYRNKRPEVRVLAGTFGYVAPEAVGNGKSTEKTDVFSYGAVVLELACGRRALEEELVLVEMVWELKEEGKILKAADKRLQSCFDVGEMERLLHVGLLCSLPDPLLRPSMAEVLLILQGQGPVPPLPSYPNPGAGSSNQNTPSSLCISIDELLSSGVGYSPLRSIRASTKRLRTTAVVQLRDVRFSDACSEVAQDKSSLSSLRRTGH